MKLNELQQIVLDTIVEETAWEDNRYASITSINDALTKKWKYIDQPALFAILSTLRVDKRIDFTGAQEELIYTLNKAHEPVE